MTKTNSFGKMLIALGCVLAMLFSMSVSAFAASPGAQEASLYTYGEYDPSEPDENLSMGDPAILGADVTYDSGANETTVVVYVQDRTFPMGGTNHTGYIKTMTLDGESGTPDVAAHPTSFTFVFDGEVTLDAEFTAVFSIYIPDYNHIVNATATLVIFE
ncbi:MAG: hypothetical protein PHU31_11175 [Anaerotignum sp.]|nr:hypothetical protein [Anaerotignum sp.]